MTTSNDKKSEKLLYRKQPKNKLSTDEFMNSMFARDTTEYNALGNEWAEKGDWEEAIKHYQKSLKIYINTLGEQHLFVAWVSNKLGLAYEGMGMYDEAIEYYNKAISIDLKSITDDNPDTKVQSLLGIFFNPYRDAAEIYTNLGIIHDRKGEHNLAVRFYEKALSIYRRIDGEEEIDVASCYNNLGLAYGDMKKYDSAVEYHNKAYTIYKKKLGRDHPHTIRSHNNLLKAKQPNSRESKMSTGHYLAIGLGGGTAIGAGIGVAMGNIPVGIGIGIALGAAFGLALSRRRESKSGDS